MIKSFISWIIILLGIIEIIWVFINTIIETKNEPIWVRILSVLTEMIPSYDSSILVGIILILFGIAVKLM